MVELLSQPSSDWDRSADHAGAVLQSDDELQPQQSPRPACCTHSSGSPGRLVGLMDGG